MLLMGCVATVGMVSTVLLPETLGAPLVECVDDQKVLYQNPKPFFSWWSTRTRRKVEELQHIESKTERHPNVINCRQIK